MRRVRIHARPTGGRRIPGDRTPAVVRRLRKSLGFGAPLLAGLLFAAAPAAAQSEHATTLDGVYTAEQAEAGRATYQKVCSGCHTLDWYTGDVVRAWEGGSLFALYEVISTTMPQDNPGSLKRRDYADLLAYILELNGLPAGETPLSTRRSRLNAIRFQFKENR